ncbi:unnamed protein product, partial [Heligmosomoides polygyrus]|uniref:Enoyl-CoA hydratase n=1 Tax=Heligmosomoides polygyrus TaxID=6339 RepID=A0A183GUI0_HELPZ
MLSKSKSEKIHYSVVRLILKDAKRRNALSLNMIKVLAKELEEINTISKVLLIIGAEGPAFSSGHDLRDLTTVLFSRADAGGDLHKEIFERCANLMLNIRRMEIPVIAEVRGIAAAAGCQLVASCDVVVAAENSKFIVPGLVFPVRFDLLFIYPSSVSIRPCRVPECSNGSSSLKGHEERHNGRSGLLRRSPTNA